MSVKRSSLTVTLPLKKYGSMIPTAIKPLFSLNEMAALESLPFPALRSKCIILLVYMLLEHEMSLIFGTLLVTLQKPIERSDDRLQFYCMDQFPVCESLVSRNKFESFMKLWIEDHLQKIEMKTVLFETQWAATIGQIGRIWWPKRFCCFFLVGKLRFIRTTLDPATYRWWLARDIHLTVQIPFCFFL